MNIAKVFKKLSSLKFRDIRDENRIHIFVSMCGKEKVRYSSYLLAGSEILHRNKFYFNRSKCITEYESFSEIAEKWYL